ncbi:endonuclease/exonuclease/phosphatase family protein [Nibrella viscosa]|uniref:Endonuclease/exonuclease/phosphatase family protein n=1 Tax=Nibrella viscosa TaxID=1084524 RepID=A0ABP8KDI2_9BACT
MAYAALSYLFFTMAFCHYPIGGHWLTGFIMMTLPLAILSGLFASIYLLCRQEKMMATAGLIWVLFSLPVVKRLIGAGLTDVTTSQAASLKVLSFNSETFPEASATLFDEGLLTADIACFQEYSPNRRVEGEYAYKLEKLTSFGPDRQVGLALFSQYPIINHYSRIWDRDNEPDINGFLCADIAYGADTIRVVNVHLWSMGVRINQAMDALKAGDLQKVGFELYDTFRRLKKGFEHRNGQLKEVESYVAGSRYPVIICGDFNETPFGYSYGKLSLNFRNAFEEAGEGLGFTLNRHPYCVRIDQQFFSADWAVRSCQTLSKVSFSDHFPVMAHYVLKTSLNAPAEGVAQRKTTIREIAQN